MVNRLEEFLKAENLSKSQFADSIGVARAGISHIMQGRNKPSYEFIVNTIKAYPALNIEWLLTGKGSMYKTGTNESYYPNSGLFSQQISDSQPLQTKEILSKKPDTAPSEADPGLIKPESKASQENPQNFDIRPADPAPHRTSHSNKRILILNDDGTFEEFT